MKFRNIHAMWIFKVFPDTHVLCENNFDKRMIDAQHKVLSDSILF